MHKNISLKSFVILPDWRIKRVRWSLPSGLSSYFIKYLKKITHTCTKSDNQTELIIRRIIIPNGSKIKTKIHESLYTKITCILYSYDVRGIRQARAGHKFKLPAECSKRRRDGEPGTRTPPLLSATRRHQRHLQAKSPHWRMANDNNNNNNKTCCRRAVVA